MELNVKFWKKKRTSAFASKNHFKTLVSKKIEKKSFLVEYRCHTYQKSKVSPIALKYSIYIERKTTRYSFKCTC